MSSPKITLLPEQFDRYRRHLTLPSVGPQGQRQLLDSKVLLIGAGGLGCPLAQYLAAAGVGALGIVDPDVVDLSNLQRQVLYSTADVGRLKVEVAEERIRALNPDVAVEAHPIQLNSENALELFTPYDVIVDGTDNFPTRYLSNDACVFLGKPNVYGSIFRFEGQASVFDAVRGPCYRCLYPEPPPPGSVPSCAEGGVFGVLPGVIAMVQATETIKLLLGVGSPLIGRLLLYDALEMEFNEFQLSKDPECPVCGPTPSVTELIDYDAFCGLPTGRTGHSTDVPRINASELSRRRDAGGEHLLIDVREPGEVAVGSIGGAVPIPLGELSERISELSSWKDGSVVVYCRSGARSERACAILLENGFSVVENLDGGIEAWSITVDPSVTVG